MTNFYASYPLAASAGGVPTYANLAAFPSAAGAGNGALAIALDTNILYESNGSAWVVLADPSASPTAITALTGDVTATGPGSVAATIANLAVTNAKIANGTIDLTTKVTGVLPVANGGTNSSTALNNNRVIISSGGKIQEQSALTAHRALATDASGLPVVSATTDTELGYVSGVTSAIQTQLNTKAATATAINTTAPLTGGGDLSASRTLAIPKATGSVDGYLAAADFTTFNGKQAAGSYITALTGDVVASGPGSVSATIQAGAVTNTKIAAAAGIDVNKLAALTISSPVRSDASGFLTTGNLNAATELTGATPIANGGTGQTSANAALNALLPNQATHAGDFLVTDATDISYQTFGVPVESRAQAQTAGSAGAFHNAASITMTGDGRWVVTASAHFIRNGGWNGVHQLMISDTTASSANTLDGYSFFDVSLGVANALSDISMAIPCVFVDVTGSATRYLNYKVDYSVAADTYSYSIQAYRIHV